MVKQWFDDNFKFDANQTQFWISAHPICDENVTDLPVVLQSFLDIACLRDYECEGIGRFCSPRVRGDGVCNIQCLHTTNPTTLCDW